MVCYGVMSVLCYGVMYILSVVCCDAVCCYVMPVLCSDARAVLWCCGVMLVVWRGVLAILL